MLVFHGNLRQLLAKGNAPEGRLPVERRASIKDVLEAAGPPHTEVGRITCNGEETGFGHLVTSGERLDVYPITPPFQVDLPDRLRPRPLRGFRFRVDENVGRLAGLLRLAGFDTRYEPGVTDERLVRCAREEGRIVLSRDRGVLKRSEVDFGRLIRSVGPEEQLRETTSFFGLPAKAAPFSRCMRCNGLLRDAAKSEIADRLQEKTRRYYETFRMCPDCGRVYWEGSHVQGLRGVLARAGFAFEP